MGDKYVEWSKKYISGVKEGLSMYVVMAKYYFKYACHQIKKKIKSNNKR